MIRILKSIGFGIGATAVVGTIAYLLVTLFDWIVRSNPALAGVIFFALFGIVIFGGMAYQDLYKD